MISYYLIVTIVDVLTAVNEDDWQIAADIKEGNISQFLLKPIDYLWFRLCLFFSGRLTFMAMAACHWRFHLLFRELLCAAAQRCWPLAVSGFAGADGAAAILHVLRDGDAGVLGAGSLHVHLHPLRLRISRQRPSVPARHLCRRRWSSCSISRRFPISCIFPSASTWARPSARICRGAC